MMLGYQASFFRFFFFSTRPTDPILGNALDSKRKKKKRGWPNIHQMLVIWSLFFYFPPLFRLRQSCVKNTTVTAAQMNCPRTFASASSVTMEMKTQVSVNGKLALKTGV